MVKAYNFVTKNGYKLAGRIYHRNSSANRKLLLLHGAGYGGEITWFPLVKNLDHWSEIWVPDLRGCGGTMAASGVEESFSIAEVLGDILYILGQLEWKQFDIVGYSFGGIISLLLNYYYPDYVSRHLVIEPPLLSVSDEKVAWYKDQLNQSMNLILDNQVREGSERFFDLIAPHRRKANINIFSSSIKSIARPIGFACMIKSVIDAFEKFDRNKIVSKINDLIYALCSNSPSYVQAYVNELLVSHPNWTLLTLQDIDHGFILSNLKKAEWLIHEAFS